ncbi:GNAT family N-acetyltransferase [Pseudalkalibacillus sp. SCS-8]|uniref:GNAT family N-acetyltransferase n=1 Tax=Pseudalkalibacillus nanhaiensis TaxID=3115291 RepID=UPI0032DAFD8E
MEKILNPSVKLKYSLDQDDYKNILALKECCLEKENVTLKLELDYKLSRSLNESIGINKINEFMFYNGKTLIGYVGICQFGKETLEVNGMVHPEYRRQGVFTRLFSLVKDEWDKRKSQQMLLLSDRNSSSGIHFIKSTGAQYDNSEYDMFLTGEATEVTTPKPLSLRRALNEDAKEIARQNAIYFQVNSSDLILPEEEEKHGTEIYMAEVDQSIVGKVHLEVQNDVGGIYGLGVLPEFRGKGYGRDLLMKAVEKLKEKQVQQIMLQVAVKNSNALNLYRSCGFEETTTMDYYKLTK